MWCLAVSMLWCSLCVAYLILGIEELEVRYRCRGRSNVRKIRIATISQMISVRMVGEQAISREGKATFKGE